MRKSHVKNDILQQSMFLDFPNVSVSRDVIEDSGPIKYPEDFEVFWKEYPSKKGKGGACRAWKTHKCGKILDKILIALKREKLEKTFLKEKKKFCPEWKNPQTWINKECWFDEPVEDVDMVRDWKNMEIEKLVILCDENIVDRRNCFKDEKCKERYYLYKALKNIN